MSETIEGPCPNTALHPPHDWYGPDQSPWHCRGVLGSAEERDRYENSILGAGMVWAALSMGQHDKVTVEIVDDDGLATNQLLVKFPHMGGPMADRGYVITVTIPEESSPQP